MADAEAVALHLKSNSDARPAARQQPQQGPQAPETNVGDISPPASKMSHGAAQMHPSKGTSTSNSTQATTQAGKHPPTNTTGGASTEGRPSRGDDTARSTWSVPEQFIQEPASAASEAGKSPVEQESKPSQGQDSQEERPEQGKPDDSNRQGRIVQPADASQSSPMDVVPDDEALLAEMIAPQVVLNAAFEEAALIRLREMIPATVVTPEDELESEWREPRFFPKHPLNIQLPSAESASTQDLVSTSPTFEATASQDLEAALDAALQLLNEQSDLERERDEALARKRTLDDLIEELEEQEAALELAQDRIEEALNEMDKDEASLLEDLYSEAHKLLQGAEAKKQDIDEAEQTLQQKKDEQEANPARIAALIERCGDLEIAIIDNDALLLDTLSKRDIRKQQHNRMLRSLEEAGVESSRKAGQLWASRSKVKNLEAQHDEAICELQEAANRADALTAENEEQPEESTSRRSDKAALDVQEKPSESSSKTTLSSHAAEALEWGEHRMSSALANLTGVVSKARQAVADAQSGPFSHEAGQQSGKAPPSKIDEGSKSDECHEPSPQFSKGSWSSLPVDESAPSLSPKH